MSEAYSRSSDRRYAGEQVDITYNLKRCIHAEFCVNHLSAVFDKNRRPWISSNAADVERVTGVIEECPSGALHYDRKDGIREAIPEKNVITLWQNGPLQFHGDLTIQGATVALEQETRATLCRCGLSNNKPFCDNTHKTISFVAVDSDPIDTPSQASGGNLSIIVSENGPLVLQGEITIINEADEILFTGDEVKLCRCGGSSRKPFCDGTHLRIGFIAE